MIIVDSEWSGVDAHKNSLLSIGAIDFSDPTRQFYGECRMWEGAHHNPEALAVNGFTVEQITDPKKKSDGELLAEFIAWAMKSKEHTIGGQNPSNDVEFMEATAHRYHIDWPMAHRVFDLHSIAYFHMLKRGITPPVLKGHSDLNLDKILSYVGIPTEPKPHNALTGAKVEAEAFSRLFFDRPLLSEFLSYPLPWMSEDKNK